MISSFLGCKHISRSSSNCGVSWEVQSQCCHHFPCCWCCLISSSNGIKSSFLPFLYIKIKSLSRNFQQSVKSLIFNLYWLQGLWTRLELGWIHVISPGLFSWTPSRMWVSTHWRILYAPRWYNYYSNKYKFDFFGHGQTYYIIFRSECRRQI